MSLRIVFKYGLGGGLFIILFAFLKSEWYYSGLYPDIFLTLIAIVFGFLGIMFRQAVFKSGAKEIPFEINPEHEFRDKLKQLSRRELEVLELLNSRYPNKEIAERLHIELSTLKTHINSIYRKLGIKNRKDLRWMQDLEPVFN